MCSTNILSREDVSPTLVNFILGLMESRISERIEIERIELFRFIELLFSLAIVQSDLKFGKPTSLCLCNSLHRVLCKQFKFLTRSKGHYSITTILSKTCDCHYICRNTHVQSICVIKCNGKLDMRIKCRKWKPLNLKFDGRNISLLP